MADIRPSSRQPTAVTEGMADRMPQRRASELAMATMTRSPDRDGLAPELQVGAARRMRKRRPCRHVSPCATEPVHSGPPTLDWGKGHWERDRQPSRAWSQSGRDLARPVLALAAGHNSERLVRQRPLELECYLGRSSGTVTGTRAQLQRPGGVFFPEIRTDLLHLRWPCSSSSLTPFGSILLANEGAASREADGEGRSAREEGHAQCNWGLGRRSGQPFG